VAVVAAPGTDTAPPPPSAGQLRTGHRGQFGWNAAALGVPLVAILGLGWHRRWISDDGLIFVRTVRQILAGRGPVLNAGERAEASTSTLWQWLLAALGWVTGADVARLAVGAGLVLTVAGFGLALDGSRRLYRAYTPSHPYLVPVGALVLLALPPVWDYATSGLETGLSTAWIGLCWWLLVRARPGWGTRWTLGAAALYGLGPLVRPDLAVVTGVFGLALLVIAWPGWRRLPVVLLVAAAVPLGYEIFRMGYYGVTVPLPAIAKEASLSFWHRGLSYLDDLVSPYLLWVPLVTLGVIAGYGLGRLRDRLDRVRVAVFGAPLLAAALLVGYVVRVGGDFMHGRMLLPALLTGLLPVFVVPLTRPMVPLVGLVALWAVACAATLRVPYRDHIGEHGVADERGQWARALTDRHPDRGSYVRYLLAQHESLRGALATDEPRLVDLRTESVTAAGTGGRRAVAYPVLGSLGAAVPLDDVAVDPFGLSYPLAAHLELVGRGRPGHEKELLYVWEVADYGDPSAPAPAGVDPGELRAARHVLSCGDVRELLGAAREPMSWDRFWRNLVGAPARTAMRLPADPYRAERTFCQHS
jgi:arabinofuranosyltransferase